ncbi:MAG: geranylgeranyl reductase family protein [Actinobacteria bacterium]|nr:geranylgeranyl reductase family protein [Actinomycetota bacterium]
MAEYDAIVIGAGPGGSSAAYHLAKAGARVLVIEKKQFPRAKTCGDGLTPRALKAMRNMDLDLMDSYQSVRGLRVVGAGGRTLHLDFPASTKYPQKAMVRTRKMFDSELAAKAQEAGATYRFKSEAVAPLFEGTTMTGVKWITKQPDPGGGVVKVDEGEVTAPITIVADGASSPFARAMGIKRAAGYPMGLAIRTYYKSDRHDDDWYESWLELRRGDVLLPGYGWIFPVGDGTVNIGVGLLTTFGRWRDVNLNQLQRWYIDLLPKSYGISHEDQTEPFKSGRLPMGLSVTKPYGDGYLLIGDAAGMVNPFNGEGIAYAMETGAIAASVVASALKGGSSTELQEYHQALHDIYGSYFRVARKFTKIIGKPKIFRVLSQVGMRSQSMMEFVFLVLANLGEEQGGKIGDRVLRAMCKLAEQDIADLKDPIVDLPRPRATVEPKNKVGAA